MAEMPPAGGRRPSAVITTTENAKKSPAISPEPSAARNVNAKISCSIIRSSYPSLPRAPIAHRHELVPRPVIALHARCQRPVVIGLEFDDVLILRHLAIAGHARTMRVEP